MRALGTLLGAALLLSAVPVATIHPFHNSYAEVDCNHQRRELQVALAVLGVEFETTLTVRTGKRVNLDRTKGIDNIIEDYLADRFVVTLADGSKPRPRFFGREDEGKTVWLYFTVPLAKKPTPALLNGVQLENGVLMELNACQRNTVELRDGKQRRVLEFDEAAKKQPLG